MKKSKLTGWRDVFAFTFVQTAKSKSFRSTTVLLGTVLFFVMVGVHMVPGTKHILWGGTSVDQTSDSEGVPEDMSHSTFVVYVNNETELPISVEDMSAFIKQSYPYAMIEATERTDDVMQQEIKQYKDNALYFHLNMTVLGLEGTMYVPEDSMFQEKEVTGLSSYIVTYIEQVKDKAVSLSQEQAEFLSMDITTSVVTSKEKTVVETLVEMYVPMIFCLVLYMCIILYGQMVGMSVATEKSSKVMELLLTSVRPLAIIVGKVLSMMVLSLSQLVGLIVISLAGNAIGVVVTKQINPQYNNILMDTMEQFDLLTVFSPIRLVCALIVFILGFTFYCTFAGFMGSTVNRGEDLSSAMTVYSSVSVIGFFLAYIPNSLGSHGTAIQTFAMIFPLSSPFILPARILTGESSVVTIVFGVLLLSVLVVASILFVAKIYELVILYNGNKFGYKELKRMLQGDGTNRKIM